MIARLILLLLLLLAAPVTSAMAASPFPSAGSGGERPSAAAAPTEPPGLVSRYLLQLRQVQASLHRQLAGAAGDVAATGSSAAMLALIGIGFLYGIFHAAGPGHGKVVITSYLLANVAQVRRGILLAATASAAQAVTAVALVGVLVLALGMAQFQTVHSVWYLEMASYLLLLLVGLALLRNLWRGGHAHDHGHCGHACGHAHHHHHHHHHAPPAAARDDRRGFLAMVAAVGLRPCSGAVILLLFSVAQGVFLAGVAGTIAMAVGTAITVSVLAILSVGARDLALRMAGSGAGLARVHTVLAASGALAIALFGAAMLAAGLTGGPQPF